MFKIQLEDSGEFVRQPRGGVYWHDIQDAQMAARLLIDHGFLCKVVRYPKDDDFVLIQRETWGADSSLVNANHSNWHRLFGMKLVTDVVSVSDTDMFSSVRLLQEQHKSDGWNDIRYNYLILPDGSVLVGRGFGVVPAGKGKCRNIVSVCFCVCEDVFVYEQLVGFTNLLGYLHDNKVRVKGVGKGIDHASYLLGII